MGKVRPAKTKNSRHSRRREKNRDVASTTDPIALLARAAALLQTGQADEALPLAEEALKALSIGTDKLAALPALSLLGEIHIEAGDPESALKSFEAAAQLDPDGLAPEAQGGGPEKFLWLAQLSEQGGAESIGWYEKGVHSIEAHLESLERQGRAEEIAEAKAKLASALCGMIEVWMTDLSFEDEAESNCETLISQALKVSDEPEPTTLQTLASIRLSQARLDDAQSALTQSMAKWKDLPSGDPGVPDFPTRISLGRLLMEAEMEETALETIERLVGDDDECVEAWYLGGWCLKLMADKSDDKTDEDAKEKKTLMMSSREWLRNCLKLYGLLAYEDERLRDHAKELVQEMDGQLGSEEIEEEDEDSWEDEPDSEPEDHEMKG